MSELQKVFVVDAARTPFTKAFDPTDAKQRRGAMANITPLNMLNPVANAMIERTDFDPALLDEVFVGCVTQEGLQSGNLGRMLVLSEKSLIPNTVPGTAMNMFCASSLATINLAAGSIMAGQSDSALCMGVESMSSSPMGGWSFNLDDSVYNGNAANFMNMGITAENLAQKYGISRQAQEAFAKESHRRVCAAVDRGAYEGEIIPIMTPDGTLISGDDCMLREWDEKKVSSLPPAFLAAGKGTITSATSSPITDGASGVILCSERFAKAHGLTPRAEIRSYASTGCEPSLMGIGPVAATRKVLKIGGYTVDDLEGLELNEAFAAQVLAVQTELGISDDILNTDGGALAIGHPLGASGGRLVAHMTGRIQNGECGNGVATACVGGGMGVATFLRAPE